MGKKMTKLELAKMLDNCQYRNELAGVDMDLVIKSNLVIVHGASDDLVEFRGAIDDELGGWGGATIFINRSGVVRNDCDSDCCPYFQPSGRKIEAISGADGVMWTYQSDIEHIEFNVLDGTDLYCKGIVFSLDEI